jgi:hypothetical protein
VRAGETSPPARGSAYLGPGITGRWLDRFSTTPYGEDSEMTGVLMAMTQAETNALLLGIVSLAFGVLILMVPRVLNYVVALYLIVIGILFIIRAL